jgi:hypothetical protein
LDVSDGFNRPLTNVVREWLAYLNMRSLARNQAFAAGALCEAPQSIYSNGTDACAGFMLKKHLLVLRALANSGLKQTRVSLRSTRAA